MKLRSEEAQTGVARRRAMGGFRRRTRQYIDESDRWWEDRRFRFWHRGGAAKL